MLNILNNNVFIKLKECKYVIFSEKNPWVQRWDLKPSKTTKNRTDGTVWAVLKDLEPNTVYWFRMKVKNIVGLSTPSDSSSSVTTGMY